MSFYCHQVSYTTDARKRLLSDSHDRYEAIRAPIEKLGGHIKSSFFTLGPFAVPAGSLRTNPGNLFLAPSGACRGRPRRCFPFLITTRSERRSQFLDIRSPSVSRGA